MQPISTVQDTVIVEFGSFLLAEFPETTRGWRPDLRDDRIIRSAGSGSTYLLSGGTDHYPHVSVEVCPAEPEVPVGWERIDEDEDVFSRPVLRLHSVTSQLGARAIKLPAAGRWRIRAASSGRADVQRLGEASFAEGVERWLLQLWPVA